MSGTQAQEHVKAKISEIRERFSRLKTTCGLQAISNQTIRAYIKEINALETQLN